MGLGVGVSSAGVAVGLGVGVLAAGVALGLGVGVSALGVASGLGVGVSASGVALDLGVGVSASGVAVGLSVGASGVGIALGLGVGVSSAGVGIALGCGVGDAVCEEEDAARVAALGEDATSSSPPSPAVPPHPTASAVSAKANTAARRRGARAGLCSYRPAGAFYLLVDLPGPIDDTYAYARLLLREADVAVAPGETFGAGGQGRVRISLAAAPDQLREGLRRLIAFAAAPPSAD